MKNIYRLNKHSSRILNVGIGICVLGYLGILQHIYELSKTEVLKSNEISLMTESVTISILIVVIFALLLDIHIKHSDQNGNSD